MPVDFDKIDAFAIDEPVATYIMVDNDDVTYIKDYLDTFEYAYTFPKTASGTKTENCPTGFSFISKMIL